MSAPETRLCGDAAAERAELIANTIISAAAKPAGQLFDMACAVRLLAEDRRARIEIAALGRERAA